MDLQAAFGLIDVARKHSGLLQGGFSWGYILSAVVFTTVYPRLVPYGDLAWRAIGAGVVAGNVHHRRGNVGVLADRQHQYGQHAAHGRAAAGEARVSVHERVHSSVLSKSVQGGRSPGSAQFVKNESPPVRARRRRNRSEAAVGYATMDGDTSGGLSPIAGIDKAYLRRWLVWMEQTGPDGVILVVRHGRLKREVLKKATDLLESVHAPILGAVLNRRRFAIPTFLYKLIS